MELIFSFNGYNLINTTLFTFIIFVGYICFYKIIKHFFPKIKIDKYFISSVLLFVLFGSLLRLLEQEYTSVFLIPPSDSILSIGFYFHTPGWLFLLAFMFLLCFFISVLFLKEKYYKLLIPFGVFLSLPLLVFEFMHLKNLSVLLVTVLTTILFYLIITKAISIFLKPLENRLIIFSQTLDSFATIFGIYFFKDILFEQHPVSRAIISFFPLLFFILKIIFSFLYIYVIDKTIKDKEERVYYKLLIIILGFLTGIRDLLTISLLIA